MRRIVPVLFCLLALYSCTEDNQSSQEKVTVQGTRVTEGRLAFRDVTHFSETLTRLQNDPGSASSILQGLSFKSLLHTIPDIEKFNSENYLLSLYSYQILLNHENEVQIGDKIYRITEASVKVFTRNGKLLDEQSNQIEVYDFITKEFVQMQPQANGRSSAFDVWYYQPVNEVPFSTHYIGYRWYKTNVGFIGKRYYYQNKFLTQASINSFGAVAYYFQFTGTSCICQYPPSTVPPEYTYNSSGMTIDVGWSTHGWEANNGVNLGVGLIMKWNSSSTILHNLSTFL